MEKTNSDIVAAIIIASIIFVILAVFTLLFFLLFVKKRRMMQREKEMMSLKFQEALLASQLEMQEHTFNAISRELHDQVGQSLSLASVQVHLLEHCTTPALLSQLKTNLSTAMQDLRDIAKSLSGERLSDMILEHAVNAEAERISKGSHISVMVNTLGNTYDFNHQQRVIIFRMIQESLQNILKHSGASEVNIELNYGKTALAITMQDNGKGFDQQQYLPDGSGLGLKNMKARSKLLNGKLDITSSPGTGCTIKIEIPYA